MKNYYADDRLSINQKMSLSEITQTLDKQEGYWKSRGSQGASEAGAALKLINEARKVFANDASRNQYDQKLQAANAPVDKNAVHKAEMEREYGNLKRCLENENYDSAVIIIERIQRNLDPSIDDLYEFHVSAVDAYSATGNMKKAHRLIDEWISREPDSPQAHSAKNYALACANPIDYELVEREAQQALECLDEKRNAGSVTQADIVAVLNSLDTCLGLYNEQWKNWRELFQVNTNAPANVPAEKRIACLAALNVNKIYKYHELIEKCTNDYSPDGAYNNYYFEASKVVATINKYYSQALDSAKSVVAKLQAEQKRLAEEKRRRKEEKRRQEEERRRLEEEMRRQEEERLLREEEERRRQRQNEVLRKVALVIAGIMLFLFLFMRPVFNVILSIVMWTAIVIAVLFILSKVLKDREKPTDEQAAESDSEEGEEGEQDERGDEDVIRLRVTEEGLANLREE